MFKLLYQFIKSYISFTSLLFNRELEEYAKELAKKLKTTKKYEFSYLMFIRTHCKIYILVCLSIVSNLKNIHIP